jgi:formamidopyrimidine-DNA glycosylase
MPELPDVALFRQFFRRTALGRTISSVEARDPLVVGSLGRRNLATELPGRTFRASRRHGKYLFARADPPGNARNRRPVWVVFHFGMTGSFVFLQPGAPRPSHARVVFFFRDGCSLLFVCPRRFGRVALVDRPEGLIGAKRLGPDPLSRGFRGLRRALSGRRGAIKAILLDQTALAGVGNLYADEVLFQAGIHPRAAAASLEQKRWGRLWRALDRVLRTAIEREVDAKGFPRAWLLPLREEGARCPRCAGRIARGLVGGRTTYFCPRHQKM